MAHESKIMEQEKKIPKIIKGKGQKRFHRALLFALTS